eukprot:scaffold2043_cov166-Amphora_coffeaeformis.AAC.22
MNTENSNAPPEESPGEPMRSRISTGDGEANGDADNLLGGQDESKNFAGQENGEKASVLHITSDGEDDDPQSTLQVLRRVAEEMVSIPINFILGKAEKPRRYLFDRCDGSSQYQDHHRPPCPIFYVPIPVRWFPDLLEQNSLCERFGRVGCVRPYDYGLRKVIFGIATFCQFAAFGLTFYAAFAISKRYRVLRHTSFTHGMGRIVGGRSGLASPEPAVEIDIGLLGIAMIDPRNLSGFGGQVISWDEFCIDVTEGFEEFFKVGICEDCGSQSRALVASMVMSLLFSIPSFTTDILRFYPDYDVNCQKFFGAIVSFISMISSLITWYGYNQGCVKAFYANEVGLFANYTRAMDKGDADIILDFDWEAGHGYVCVAFATLLKIVDVVCNLAVPTPQICRDHAEQAMYEIVAINRDVNEGNASHYTPENARALRASVMMAKAEMSHAQCDIIEEPSGDEEARAEMSRGQLDNIEESLDDEENASPRHPSAILNMPDTPLPSPRDRDHQSVYF